MATIGRFIGLSGLAAMGLAACAQTAPPPPLLSISPGSYSGVLSSGCGTLVFPQERRLNVFATDEVQYLADADCNGQAEGSVPAVVVEDVITIGDIARLQVTAVGAQSFSGLWTSGGGAEEVRFQRGG